jgi:hypothetical protein
MCCRCKTRNFSRQKAGISAFCGEYKNIRRKGGNVMADIGKTVKEIWEQSMKAVNKAATNIATSTKQKVDEMNIVTRRKELQNQLGLRLYELWQAGEDVPETLKATLEEMRDLEVKLQELRESKTTAPEDEKSAETPDSAAHAPDTTDVKVPLEDDDVPTIEMPDIPEKPERPMEAPSIHTDDETPAE